MNAGRILPLAGAAALVAVVHAAAGWPDPRAVGEILGGTVQAGGAALVQLLCWLAVLGVGVSALQHSLRSDGPGATSRGTTRALLLLVAGLALLTAGILRHASGYTVCCADPATDRLVQTIVR